jgi:DNA-directed RNA polymerase specialized sigma24 family protein
VDLLTSYSNRHDLCGDLQQLTDQLQVEVARDAAGIERVSVRSVQPEPKVRRIADRLGEEEVCAVIVRFEQGVPKHILAEEYGISLSSIKNLLRKYNARQPWRVADRLTPQDIEALRAAYHQGISQSKLAARYKISLSTVAQLVRQRGEA